MTVLGSAGDAYEEEGVGDGALEWTTFFFYARYNILHTKYSEKEYDTI